MLRRRRAGEKSATHGASAAENEDEEYDEEAESHKSAVNAILDWARNYQVHDNNDGDSDAESVIQANEDLDSDDHSFVEDDGELGAPEDVSVPFEFSRHRTKSTKDCFRDVVEWMVHSKLNPGFRRNDEMYKFAFQKLGDEVVGRVESQLVSSVWNADFRNALRARPYLDVSACPTFHDCDACNRTNHPASSDLKFTGKPYSDETLEPLFDSDSDSDNSDSDDEDASGHRNQDRDREGHVLPPEERHFYLGRHVFHQLEMHNNHLANTNFKKKRTCKSNAVLTHTLVHWRFHLYEWVVDYLNRTEELLSNPERSLEREKLSAKKRTKYANKVVDKMDSSGEVQRLWMDFHQNLRVVRETKVFPRPSLTIACL
jgi:Domain of unknown function (DUF4211)